MMEADFTPGWATSPSCIKGQHEQCGEAFAQCACRCHKPKTQRQTQRQWRHPLAVQLMVNCGECGALLNAEICLGFNEPLPFSKQMLITVEKHQCEQLESANGVRIVRRIEDIARCAADEIDTMLVPLSEYSMTPGVSVIEEVILKHAREQRG